MSIRHRLKTDTSWDSIQDRLRYNPEIMELQLFDKDLDNIQLLQQCIRYLQELGITVYLHHPRTIKGVPLDILSNDPNMRDFYQYSSRLLAKISREEGIKCVVHCHYAGTSSSYNVTLERTLQIKKEIEHVLTFASDVFLWEDSCYGLFAHSNPYLVEHVVKPLQLPLVLDVSHSFIATEGSNELLMDIVRETEPYVQYLHVVDSLGQEHDGLELGQGLINWKDIKPYINNKPFIFEISLPNVKDCYPMVKSKNYWETI